MINGQSIESEGGEAERVKSLDMILRAKEIHTIVMFSVAMSGVVLSTLLEASDADYRLVVVEDCCVDLDMELHSALTTRCSGLCEGAGDSQLMQDPPMHVPHVFTVNCGAGKRL
jgi:hypothetical protein